MPDLTYEFRPIGVWADQLTPAEARKRSPFKASYEGTLSMLLREAELLGASRLVFQVDLQPSQIRADGFPKANARYGTNPGVIVSFDSRHGPLRYATDAYDTWKSNLRAIALGLEALRAVDRYGVSKSGQQYRGWAAITSGTSNTVFATQAEAETWLRKAAAEEGIGSWPTWDALYKALAKRMHPNAGGNAELWGRLDAAATLLGVRGGRG